MVVPGYRQVQSCFIALPLLGGLLAAPAMAQQLPPPAPQPPAAQPPVAHPRPAKKPPVTIVTPSDAPPSDRQGNSPDIIVLPPPAGETPGATPDTPDTTPPPDNPVIIIDPTPTPPVTPRGVPSVGGIKVGGMTDVAALHKLADGLTPKLHQTVTLSDGTRTYTLRRDTLGAKIPLVKLLREAQRIRGDIPVRFEVDLALAQHALARLAGDINRSARPASLDYVDGRVVVAGGDGVKLSVSGSDQRVKQALEARPAQSRVDLVVARTPGGKGAVSAETLGQMHYLLASFATKYDASIRGRTHNLHIAARNVNGTLIPDGEIFSANRAIGRRDAADGWQEAKMFVSGQVVSGTGAGICQCASTLYNAALLADLPIVERHAHMFPVSYAPPSRDATLYWGSKDLRFRNNTGGPIYVQTFLADGRFHVRLFGTQPVRDKITVEAHTTSRQGGIHSVAYRIIENESGRQRQLLSRDSYMPHP